MDMNELMTFISTVGFPIVMTLLMFWRIEKQEESHDNEMTKITEALNNNTKALIKLSDKIGGDIDV